MADLRIDVDGQELSATWVEENPETRDAIVDALPLSGDATRWGQELYFSIPVDVPLETGQTELPVGAIAYWPQGNALCLFWGPTPVSKGEEPRAASSVSVVATIEDVTPLSTVEGGARVSVTEG